MNSLSERRAFVRCLFSAVVLVVIFAASALRLGAEDSSAVEQRLSQSAKFLASDELEGRGVGTEGLNKAADYIAQQFRQIGLKTDLYDGGPFQSFKVTTGAKLAGTNQLSITGPEKDGQAAQRIEFKLGQTYNPLSIGGSGKFTLPLVFVGYGITAKHEAYDDYAGIDVKGKAVVVLRHEPQQANPHSVFDGTKTSQYAPFKRKVSNAYEHGAAAVIFVNDEFDVQKTIAGQRKRLQTMIDQLGEENSEFKAITDPVTKDWTKHQEVVQMLAGEIKSQLDQLHNAEDPLLGFEGAGDDSGDSRDFPVLFVRRSAIAPVIESTLGKTLADLESEIDRGPTPHSRELTGWKIEGQVSIEREQTTVKNVVGVLEGEGPLANETIVLGAHYDHLGLGGPGSLSGGVKEIHNGADDNGSGTSVLIEVARELAARPKKLPRRVVFIAFTGEERGLLGSARYIREPLYPLDKTIAMVNMDMVGRLQDDKLIVHGTGTSAGFDRLADQVGKEFGFAITKKESGFGPSDHSSFYAAKVPVLFFFTGSHSDYHRPSDDFEKLNIAGMRRIASMVAKVVTDLAESKEPPQYQETKSEQQFAGGGGDRPYFGSIPDFAQDQPGYALTGVSAGGPAAKAGIIAGDIIVQLGDSKIGNLEDFDSALRKYKAGDKVPVTVKRKDQLVKVEVTLDPPR